MRVGIHIDSALDPSPSGIGRHVAGLVSSLLQLSVDTTFLFYASGDMRLRMTDSPILERIAGASNAHLRRVPVPRDWLERRPRVWWDVCLPLLLLRDRIDVFHGPAHRIPWKSWMPRRWASVVTIHDLAFMHMTVHGAGLDAYLTRSTRRSVEDADLAIAVSKATASDCEELLQTPNRKLRVVFQGFEAQKPSVGRAPATELKEDQRFILFIGSVQPRKNVPLLIDAFAGIADRTSTDLVIAGGDGGDMLEARACAERRQVIPRIHFLGYVSDEERAWLYERARVVAYPSRYEGFGLVLLEAMSAGVPVITTRAGAIPEVVGDAGICVDPDDIDALSEEILRLVEDDELRREYVSRGYSRVEQFTWARCAEATHRCYEEAHACSLA